MKLTKPFSQGEVMKRITVSLPTPGICFRLTFKWAACTLAGGAFNYNPNANKTATKHVAYRQKTLAMHSLLGGDFSDSEDFYRYITVDWNETRRFVNIWGASFTDADKSTFTGVYVEDQSDDSVRQYLKARRVLGTAAILAVFYGRKGSAVWGHVVAFCTHGGPTTGGPCMFDANYGLFEFAGSDDIPELLWTYICHYYRTGGRTIEAFNTMVLKQR